MIPPDPIDNRPYPRTETCRQCAEREVDVLDPQDPPICWACTLALRAGGVSPERGRNLRNPADVVHLGPDDYEDEWWIS